MMPRIFTNYRHEDRPDIAKGIHERFKLRFGSENVFIDVDNIPPSIKWKERIEQEISKCDVLVIIIGPSWIKFLDEKLINNQEDYVSFEINLALVHKKRIVPICIEGATLPRKNELPISIQNILEYQAVPLPSGGGFLDKLEQVIDEIYSNLPLTSPDKQINNSNSPKIKNNETKRKSKVSLKLELPMNQFKPDELVELVAKFVQAGIEDISILNIGPGSVIVDLEMDKEAAQKLLEIVKTRPQEFSKFNLASITIDDQEPFRLKQVANSPDTSMNLNQRILIVENLEPLQKQYKMGLRLANFEADTASELDEAIAAIDNRNYAVIMVDLMLNDPIDTKLDGLAILEHVRELHEGTKTLVVSGQTSIETALETQKTYGSSDYVEKTKILNEGMDYLIDKITGLLKETKIELYGPYKNVMPILAGGYAKEIKWSDQFLQGLRPKGDMNDFHRFLMALCSTFVPILPEDDVMPPLKIKPDLGIAEGRFWSKGKGIGIQLVIGHKDRIADFDGYLASNHLDKQAALSKIETDETGLVGYVFQLGSDVPRDLFLSKLPPDASAN